MKQGVSYADLNRIKKIPLTVTETLNKNTEVEDLYSKVLDADSALAKAKHDLDLAVEKEIRNQLQNTLNFSKKFNFNENNLKEIFEQLLDLY